MVSLGIFGGCQKEVDGIPLVIIIGNHANANSFINDTEFAKVKSYIEESFDVKKEPTKGTFYFSGNLSVIVCDGNSTKVDTEKLSLSTEDGHIISFDELTYGDGYNQISYALDDVSEKANNVWKMLSSNNSLKADSNDVDLLGAISEANVTLNQLGSAEKKRIVIIDTGITTAGLFDMTTNNIMEAEAKDVVAKIGQGAFPELKGVEVIFFGLGNVAEPQQDLRIDNSYRKKLEEIWTIILEEKCQASLPEKIFFSAKSGKPMMWYEEGTSADEDWYPYVKPVVFIEPTPIPTPTSVPPKGATPAPTKAPEPPKPVFLSGLGFVKDSNKFNDEKYSINMITDYAPAIKEYLQYNPDKKVYVVGSIALTEPGREHREDNVSLIRAQRVAGILEDNGIERVEVIDAGTTIFSWRNAVEFPDGTIASKDNNALQSNRLVAIICEGKENDTYISELQNEGYMRR
jgi:hypothetical protein